MNIAVAGTGYVGLVTGVCLCEVGHNVTCVDIDIKKVETMKKGISPIYEPGLEQLIKKNIKSGHLKFTTNYEEAYKYADVIFIGVGTPEREDGSANLDYVYKVAKQIADNIKKDSLIVVKSTVPIGSNDKLEKYIKENLKNDVNVEVASNPEFLAQGTAVKDTLKASRIIIGVESESAEKILRKVYEDFNQPMVVTNRRSAEMIKYASNDFLALKISYINEIANQCEILGANIEDVALGMGYDSRIGNKFLRAGIGYGGSCFPKDTKALYHQSKNYGYELKTIKAAIDVNEEQKLKLIEKARKKFKSFKNLNVAILGLTFKPGTDDLREAPSIPNIKILLEEEANIKAYDPVGINNFKKLYPTEITYFESPEETLIDCDVAFIFTEWNEIRDIDLKSFKKNMKYPLVYDGRNCYKLKDAKNAGMQYYSIGR